LLTSRNLSGPRLPARASDAMVIADEMRRDAPREGSGARHE